MKTFFRLLLTVAALAVAGCQTKGPAFEPRSETSATFTDVPWTNRVDPGLLKAPQEPYRLGPGDVITVEALGEAGPATELTVGVDGRIYYSLLPGISVWGLSLPETRSLLEQELGKYANPKPTLVLNLRAAGSRRVWVLGGAANSVFPLAAPATLLEAISSLGGTTTFANTRDEAIDFSRSFILRNGRRLQVDFAGLLKNGDLTQNIYLEPDDFIYMPHASQASVYVLGAVAGAAVLPYNQNLTMAQALVMAGSTIKYAYSTRVAIIRGGLTQPRIAQVDYKAIAKGKATDVRLEPGDIVYVRDVPGKFLLQLAEDVLDEFVRTIAVNEGIYVGSGESRPIQPSAAFGTPAAR